MEIRTAVLSNDEDFEDFRDSIKAVAKAEARHQIEIYRRAYDLWWAIVCDSSRPRDNLLADAESILDQARQKAVEPEVSARPQFRLPQPV